MLQRHVPVAAVVHDRGRIVMNPGAEQDVILHELQDPDPGRVDQPEVIARQVKALRPVAGQVADVLPRRNVDPREVQEKPRVAVVWLADNPDPGHPLAVRSPPAHHRFPLVVPRVVRLSRQEPPERLILLPVAVPFPLFQPERGALVAQHEPGELLAADEPAHPPSVKRSNALGIST